MFTVDRPGNLFVQNPGASLTARMQNYDYLLSIAAIKRFQGSYQATLVAQGAVGYTVVPETLDGLYNQRRRWAIGMLEGLSAVPPWKQGNAYSRYFTSMNLAVIYLDLTFLFGLHTFSHRDLTALNQKQIQQEIQQTEETLDAIDCPLVLWTIDSGDWDNPDAEKIYHSVAMKL